MLISIKLCKINYFYYFIVMFKVINSVKLYKTSRVFIVIMITIKVIIISYKN